MAPLSAARLGVWPAVVLCACGSLTDASYSGTAKKRIETTPAGNLTVLAKSIDHARVSLFWFPQWPPIGFSSYDGLLEQPSSGRSVAQSFSFSWFLYDEPTQQQLTLAPGGKSVGFAMPLVYDDLDGNHRRTPDEPLLGRSGIQLVLYAPEAMSASESPTGVALPAGFHQVVTALECPPTSPVSTAAGSETCGAKIGATCMTNADCGSGECLTGVPWPWPGGMCSLTETAAQGCQPAGSTLWRNLSPNLPKVWLPSCTSDADCRALPYHCDLSVGACLPSGHIQLVFESPLRLQNVCRTPMGGGPMP